MSLERSYKILNLVPGATLDEVKKAFRSLAFRYHPDLHPNMPEASRRFQELNEAYIAVSGHLQKPSRSAKTNGQPGPDQQPPPSSSASSKTAGHTRQGWSKTWTAHAQYRRQAAYQREEILRDLLRDPFARQVYEDIYSQVRRSGRSKAASVEEHAKKVLRVEWGSKKLELDLSRNLKDRVTGWLKKQLDDEQTVYFPAAQLQPGRSVRVQVRQGWRGPAVTLDIALPLDFMSGRPIRLKGRGRKVGPWKGDLFLKIFPKTDPGRS
ncbi:MAG TPA: molecular chaperone DnaJ [Desulfonatronum sp.]|nr:molecular chaperone DnaJ [Desulfonatronum sp.]